MLRTGLFTKEILLSIFLLIGINLQSQIKIYVDKSDTRSDIKILKDTIDQIEVNIQIYKISDQLNLTRSNIAIIKGDEVSYFTIHKKKKCKTCPKKKKFKKPKKNKLKSSNTKNCYKWKNTLLI